MAALEIALIVALILTLVDHFGYDVLSQKVRFEESRPKPDRL
jgi:hypothetical protein